MTLATVIRTASALLVVIAFAACGSNVSPEHYEKITAGMTEKQVGKILSVAIESRNYTIEVGETFTSTQSKCMSDRGTIAAGILNGEMQWKR
jgi:ABC-type metal ion transport system substrate-binding protein